MLKKLSKRIDVVHCLHKEISREGIRSFTIKVYDRIIKQLISLSDNPRPHGVKKLHGREGYRIRVGDYRILYVIDDNEKKVEIVSAAHRKEVYH